MIGRSAPQRRRATLLTWALPLHGAALQGQIDNLKRLSAWTGNQHGVYAQPLDRPIAAHAPLSTPRLESPALNPCRAPHVPGVAAERRNER